MRARIVLEEFADDGRTPLVLELTEVVKPSGEKLEIATFGCPNGLVASHHLGRAPVGRPLFVYTRDPEGAR